MTLLFCSANACFTSSLPYVVQTFQIKHDDGEEEEEEEEEQQQQQQTITSRNAETRALCNSFLISINDNTSLDSNNRKSET
jgi:organic hydroperoxide reductase OsmC/OhrA